MQIWDINGGTFPSLAHEEQIKLAHCLRDDYDSGEVILDYVENWKKGADNTIAGWLEHIFGKATKVNPKIDTRADNSHPLNRDEVKVAEELHDLSVKVLNNVFGSSITIYRGYGHELPEILQEACKSPASQNINISDSSKSKLSCFSINREAAVENYSRLILVKEDIRTDHIALAPDFIFGFGDSTNSDSTDILGTLSPDGEVLLKGDEEFPAKFSQFKIAVGNSGNYNFVPLKDFITSIPNLNKDEHQAMREIVEELAYKHESSISNNNTKLCLNDWATKYKKDTGNDVQNLINEIEK